MTQYNTLNVKVSYSKLNTLKSEIKMVLKLLPWNLVGNSNDKVDLPHKLLLTDTQVLRLS